MPAVSTDDTRAHLLSPKAFSTERVKPPVARYAFRRTWRAASAAGPRDAARTLFDIRAARYSWLVKLRDRATSTSSVDRTTLNTEMGECET